MLYEYYGAPGYGLMPGKVYPLEFFWHGSLMNGAIAATIKDEDGKTVWRGRYSNYDMFLTEWKIIKQG